MFVAEALPRKKREEGKIEKNMFLVAIRVSREGRKTELKRKISNWHANHPGPLKKHDQIIRGGLF